MSNATLHINEIYETGKTVFRDNSGAFPDYNVYLTDLMAKWSLVNTLLLIDTVKTCSMVKMHASFCNYVRDEMKQCCIDFYGEK